MLRVLLFCFFARGSATAAAATVAKISNEVPGYGSVSASATMAVRVYIRNSHVVDNYLVVP